MLFPNLEYGIGSTSYKNYHTTKQNRYMYMEGVVCSLGFLFLAFLLNYCVIKQYAIK